MLFTLYSNTGDLKSSKQDKENIHRQGIQILSKSIETQFNREKIIYNSLGIKDINLDKVTSKEYFKEKAEEIKNAIYKIDKNNDKANIDECMKLLVDHIGKLIIEPKSVNGDIKAARDALAQMVNEFKLMKKDGQKYLNTYINSIFNLGDSFNAQEGMAAIGNWNNFLDDFKINEDENLKDKILNGELDKKRVEEILKKYKSLKNDIIGSIGEMLSTYYFNMGANIIGTYTTSGWGTTNKKINYKNEMIETRVSEPKNIKNSFNNISAQAFHKENEDMLQQLNEAINKLEIESVSFKLKVSSELKADEVYVIEINPEVSPELFYFGISNKTSYSKSKILKIQTTSLESLVKNIYKVATINSPEKINNFNNTLSLSDSLKQLALNGVYYNWSKEEGGVDFEDFKNIVNFVVDYYGYVWFTGGIEDKSHADFFSAYSKGILHFVPMSFILYLIFDAVTSNKHFFSPLDINKYTIAKKMNQSDYSKITENLNKELKILENKKKDLSKLIKKAPNEELKRKKREEKDLIDDEYDDKKMILENIYFSQNLYDTIEKFHGTKNRMPKQMVNRNRQKFDVITADKIIAAISKSEAQIKVNSQHYKIIMG